MNDSGSVLSHAIAKRAKALADRDAASADFDRWDGFIRMYSEILGGGTQLAVAARSSGVGRSSTRGKLSVTEDAVISVLEEAGSPLHTRELLDKLLARGVEVGGKDPASTLSARLSRSSKLLNNRLKGWWIRELADDVVPEAGESSANSWNPHLHEGSSSAKGREAGPGGGT